LAIFLVATDHSIDIDLSTVRQSFHHERTNATAGRMLI
jgi:hypothetical protein